MYGIFYPIPIIGVTVTVPNDPLFTLLGRLVHPLAIGRVNDAENWLSPVELNGLLFAVFQVVNVPADTTIAAKYNRPDISVTLDIASANVPPPADTIPVDVIRSFGSRFAPASYTQTIVFPDAALSQYPVLIVALAYG